MQWNGVRGMKIFSGSSVIFLPGAFEFANGWRTDAMPHRRGLPGRRLLQAASGASSPAPGQRRWQGRPLRAEEYAHPGPGEHEAQQYLCPHRRGRYDHG